MLEFSVWVSQDKKKSVASLLPALVYGVATEPQKFVIY